MSIEEMAWSFPENVANIVRTILKENKTTDDAKKTIKQRVAALLLGLGEETSARVLKYLTDLELEQISQAITECTETTSQQQHDIFQEVKRLLLDGTYTKTGGLDVAKSLLEKAIGPQKAQGLLDRTTSSGFYMLRNVAPDRIVPFISKEHPQTIALILSQLDPTQSAGVLNGLSEELQADIMFRMAQMGNISQQVLRELEESLANDLQAILSDQITEIGGPKAVAEILNSANRHTERSVIERIDKQDQTLSEEVRNQMFTFDDIATLTDRELQILLQEVSIEDLTIAIQGANAELVERIQVNLDDERRTRLNQEVQKLDELLVSDIEAVQLHIVKQIRQLEDDDKLRIVRGNEVKVAVKQQRRLEDLVRDRTRELEETHSQLQELQTQQIKEMEEELQTAHDLQMSLMPLESPHIDGLDISGQCIPANHVSGDFFQYFQKDGKLFVCLADVTGHAMDAAIPMLMFNGILETHIEIMSDVPQLFERLNQSLHRMLRQGPFARTFVRFTVGELSLLDHHLQLCNAACPPPYYYNSVTDKLIDLRQDAYPLGVHPDTSYEPFETSLNAGDYLIFCSDGVMEVSNEAEEQLGYDRTSEVIVETCREKASSQEVLNHILNTANTFKGNAPRTDDMTCVVMRIQ
jgi:flagellar motor switch protein FliG